MTSNQTEPRVFSYIDRSQGTLRSTALNALIRLAALPEIQRIRQIARTALGVGPGQRILDAGCGAGEEARELARLVGPEGQVTAIDMSAMFVACAAERDSGSGVHYTLGDVTRLDFPANGFDGVRCERVLQHVADPGAAVAELVRVVRPGGRVCLIDTDWDSFLLDGMPRGLAAELDGLGRQLGIIQPTGRKLRGHLVRAGLTEITAEPITIAMTDRATAEALHPSFDIHAMRMVGIVPQTLVDAWSIAFDTALARGDFLGALTLWVVSGAKPR